VTATGATVVGAGATAWVVGAGVTVWVGLEAFVWVLGEAVLVRACDDR
jgi:hypothetical protein